MAVKKASGTVDVTSDGDKPKRTRLSAAERIAKMQAELDAAKKKEEAKAEAKRGDLVAKRAKLIARRDVITNQIIDLSKQIGDEPVLMNGDDVTISTDVDQFV